MWKMSDKDKYCIKCGKKCYGTHCRKCYSNADRKGQISRIKSLKNLPLNNSSDKN
jgi:hypothetical protein